MVCLLGRQWTIQKSCHGRLPRFRSFRVRQNFWRRVPKYAQAPKRRVTVNHSDDASCGTCCGERPSVYGASERDDRKYRQNSERKQDITILSTAHGFRRFQASSSKTVIPQIHMISSACSSAPRGKTLRSRLLAACRASAHWRLVPAPRRAEILFRAAQLLAERKETLAREMTREMGKVP